MHQTTSQLSPDAEVRGLVVDWGGVLTTDLHSSMSTWAEEEQIDLEIFVGLMRQWLGREAEEEAWINPVHAMERGEMEIPHFEVELANALSDGLGRKIEAKDLVTRMLGNFRSAPQMTALVRRARESGIRTGLLSNSWGADKYPEHLFDGMFDVVVISGQVGMRKPEERIYRHTVDLMEMPASACVFVDDLPFNVAAAVDVGFIGIHHESYERTADELEALFGIPLAGPTA